VKGWSELKDAFWAAVEREPAEQARHVAALASSDPALGARLEALLAADARGESLQHLFQAEPMPTERPARIGAYDVIGVLGVGGMGEVYRARDPRLHREVAIKVLPAVVVNDPERLARFEREAQVLASLNHPHIAQIYGLDESGRAPALVMELVPGPTLATLIAAYPDAPLTMARALTIARQIADGLDAAHQKGVIHRDLKPGNVALTQDGDVKILDFGVAKSLDTAAPEAPRPPMATDAGVVLGTPAYMSPEQARGLAVDRRTDIWAFGCLLYELLTGRQPFGGITPSDSLAAVLEREPDMTIVPAGTPAGVRSLLRHCLEKDPRGRLRDIADARLALDDALNRPADRQAVADISAAGSSRPRPTVPVRTAWLLAGLGGAAATAIVLTILAGPSPADQPPRTIVSVVLPRGMKLAGSDLDAQRSESRFAVSPDGRKLALIAAEESGRTRLWLRDLATAAFQPLPETDDASFPFWSPDSGSVGFVAAGKLKTIRLSGGTPVTVSDAGFRTGAWGPGNLILFAPTRSSPLYVVPATGGVPAPATRLDKASGEVQHGSPAFLPDGRHFLYFSIGSLSGALDPRGVYLGSLDATEPAKLLLPGATAARYANGHVLFVQNGTLMAQPFELPGNVLRGAPFPLVEDVKLATAGATGDTASFGVSDNGVLVYQAAPGTESQPVSFDRAGRQLAALATAADYSDVALSPDGQRLAMSVRDPARSTRDLWLYGIDDSRGQRLTFGPADEFAPVWSPDGRRLLFSSMTNGLVDLLVKEVNGAGDALHVQVDNLGLGRYAADWSRDGRYIMYIGGGRAIQRSDLWVAPMASPRQARALLDSGFVETHGRFAPRRGWFAYASTETGQLEVYIDRFPERGAKRLVSTKGGGWPRWASDGGEMFYLSPDNQLMAVAVQADGDRLDLARPRPLFAVRPRPPVRLDAYPYDVSPDGQRFVVNTLTEDTTSTTITVVLNWTAGSTKR
jgi:serine/threonine protein kinase/Tol biopolymer transport system component